MSVARACYLKGLTKQQLAATETRHDRWLAVSAGAGAGKTRVLAARFVRLLEEGDAALGEIVAITFTRKAQAEMAGRVLAFVSDRIAELRRVLATDMPARERDEAETCLARLLDARDGFHANRISTIDSFCRSALEAHALEAGLEPGFGLIDERELQDLPREAVRRLTQRLGEMLARLDAAEAESAAAGEDVRAARAASALFAMLGQRNAEQLLAIVYGRQEHTHTAMAAWNQFSSDADIAAHVTLGARLGEHMLARALAEEDLRNEVLECLATAKAVLRRQPEDATAAPAAALCQAVLDGRLAPEAVSFTTNRGSKKEWGEAGYDKKLVTELRDRLKAVLKECAADREAERLSAQALRYLSQLMPALCAEFEHAKAGALDFDDLKRLLLAFIERPSESTARDSDGQKLRARPASDAEADSRRDELARGIKYLMLDEFQDTDPAQWRLVQRILASGRTNLFFVGDDKQSIYAFRGADARVFREATEAVREHNGATAGEVRLTKNYRSLRAPLLAGNAMFEHVLARTSRLSQKASGLGSAFDVAPLSLEAARSSDDAGTLRIAILPPPPKTHGRGDDGDESEPAGAITAFLHQRVVEAAWVAQHIRDELIGKLGCRPSEIAVLTRTNDEIALLRTALAATGVPHRVGATPTLLARQETIDYCALLRAVTDPDDHLATLGVMRSPFCGVSDTGLALLFGSGRKGMGPRERWQRQESWPSELARDDRERLTEAWARLQALRRASGRLPLAQFASLAAHDSGGFSHGSGSGLAQRAANLRRLADTASSFEIAEGGGLAEYAAWLSASLEAEAPMTEGAPDGDVVLARAADSNARQSAGEVELLTIHKAKGKEWRAVVLPFMSRNGNGYFDLLATAPSEGVLDAQETVTPSWLAAVRADDPTRATREQISSIQHRLIGAARKSAATAELRRLLYVAWTRARDHLTLTIQAKSAKASGPAGPVDPEAVTSMQDVLLAALGLSAEEATLAAAAAEIERWLSNTVGMPGTVQVTAERTAESKPFAADPVSTRLVAALERANQEVLVPQLLRGDSDAAPEFAQRPMRRAPSAQQDFEYGFIDVPDPVGAETTQSAEFGILVHDTLRDCLSGEPSAPETHTRRNAARLFPGDDARADKLAVEALDHVQRTLVALGQASQKLTALPEMDMALDDGEFNLGRLDLAYELSPGHWRVVDFKTGDNDPHYAEQLRAYAVGLYSTARARGIAVTRVDTSLLFTRSGELRDVASYDVRQLSELSEPAGTT